MLGLIPKSLLLSIALVVLTLAALKLLVLYLQPHLAFYPVQELDITPRSLDLPYREIAVRTADGEKVYAWLLEQPEPRPEVVFWHGNGGNLSIWLDVIAGIHAEGLTVLALDYRGYGKSTGSPSEQGLYRDTEALLRVFREQVHRAPNPVIYWGRSLGATMAAYAARLAPPDALILEAPFVDARSVVRGDPVMALLALFASYRFPTTDFLREFGGPVLVIHGERDGIVPPEQGRRVFDRLRGPKRLVTIPDAGHNDLHEADPAAYWRAVRAFIEEVRSREPTT
jgi:uncharacterized protein